MEKTSKMLLKMVGEYGRWKGSTYGDLGVRGYKTSDYRRRKAPDLTVHDRLFGKDQRYYPSRLKSRSWSIVCLDMGMELVSWIVSPFNEILPPSIICLSFSGFSINSSEKMCNILLLFIPLIPFQHNDSFWRSWKTSLLKTLWKKEKLLIMSKFSITHSVFYPFRELSAIFIKFKIVVCRLFQFGPV